MSHISLERRTFIAQATAAGAAVAVGASTLGDSVGSGLQGQLTVADFSPHVGSSFQVETDEGVRLATLIEAEALPAGGKKARKRQPFSLILRTAENHTASRIYRICHPQMGELEMFLSPVGRLKVGTRFQAIFS